MTRLGTLVAKAVGTDSFGFANYNQLKADMDYLVIAGADLAAVTAGNTLTITSEFHKITAATGNVDNVSDALGAVAGQQIRLWFTNAQTLRNNGGGAGNIRTLSGVSKSIRANEVVTLVYDGALWHENGPGSPPTSLDGSVSSAGGIVAGSGFTITKGGAGIYTINFTVAFPTVPIVVTESHAQNTTGIINPPPTVSSAAVTFLNASNTPLDGAFGFWAVAT